MVNNQVEIYFWKVEISTCKWKFPLASGNFHLQVEIFNYKWKCPLFSWKFPLSNWKFPFAGGFFLFLLIDFCENLHRKWFWLTIWVGFWHHYNSFFPASSGWVFTPAHGSSCFCRQCILLGTHVCIYLLLVGTEYIFYAGTEYFM